MGWLLVKDKQIVARADDINSLEDYQKFFLQKYGWWLEVFKDSIDWVMEDRTSEFKSEFQKWVMSK